MRISLFLSIVVIAGCEKDNPLYCEGHPADPSCVMIDAPTDTPPAGCTSNAQCSTPTAVCDLGNATCVQCTATEPGACTGANPVCGGDDTCHPCTTHGQCASDVCLPDGSCSDGSNVAYVDPSGTDNMNCTKAMPCTKVLKALATSRPYVKFTGSTNEQVSINNQNVSFLADAGAKLTSTSNGILLKVDGTSQIAIYDLEITGASGASNPGISLQPGNMAILVLHHVRLTSNIGGGVIASGGTLTVTQSTITGNIGGGVTTSGGTLTVSQSTISSNVGGGISVSGAGATFDIRNNFIYRNGDQDVGTFGGLSLGIAVAGSNRLEFNTIVDNRAFINSGGVICNVPTFMGPNNVIVRNSLAGSSTAAGAQTTGACTYPTSTVANDTTGLAFTRADALPYDYHLLSGSTAIDHGTTATTTAIDFDGDARPQGSADDQGADEFKP